MQRKREEIEKEIVIGGTANEYNQKLIIELLLDIRENTEIKEPIF